MCVLALFDMDGTLAASRLPLPSDIIHMIKALKAKNVIVAIVTGSDHQKVMEQVNDSELFDYLFCENGTQIFYKGNLINSVDLSLLIAEEKTQSLINFALRYMSEMHLPKKRGIFVEYRRGMINLCLPGRSIDQEGREAFAEFDRKTGIRANMRKALEENFASDGWVFAAGGQISIDCYLQGMDKRYCLRHIQLPNKNFEEPPLFSVSRVVFFGDRCREGGNDYEIYHDDRVEGVEVENWQDTIKKCADLFELDLSLPY